MGMLPVAAVLGAPAGVNFSRTGVDSALIEAWHNTGNFIFQYAFILTIANPKLFVPLTYPAHEIKQVAQILVIPAANLINPAWDLADWANIVEGADLPVFIAGLGAQAPLNASPTQLSLRPGSERFLKAVAERAALIGVRGKFTAEVLDNLGVRNTTITGCPSNFINMRVTGDSIARLISGLAHNDSIRLAYLVGLLEPHTMDKERALFNFARAHGADAIVQTHGEFFKSYFSEPLTSFECRRFAANCAAIDGTQASTVSLGFASYLKQYMRLFSDARTWIDAAGRYDLSIGMRIHGAIAAIAGGGLGVCVPPDMRILELVEEMGYPYVELGQIEDPIDLRQVKNNIIFSAAAFDRARAYLSQNYFKALKMAGLEAASLSG